MVHRGVENHFAQCNYILAKSIRYAQNSLGDGNCYFRCLSLHFFGSEDFHEKIRRRVVQFIIDNIDSFRDDIQLNLNSLTVDQYLFNMLDRWIQIIMGNRYRARSHINYAADPCLYS